ncbi:aerobic C4-dicarboxylate transport protein [Methylogaea oryzae]|uniref:Aerobic C4-dicarboxylate transport protein n=1 Tax=Methylogaea oryzae TaxID=1295382 RepID=A0A8D4VMC3_9GAMM|nr:aerobic C4-dicarboxylate transport protein [Methylogaea oryzae]
MLLAVALGVSLGCLWPEAAVKLKPLGDAFVKLVKMLIGPIIFATVAVGIARVGEVRGVGRVGAKALLYFELVSTLALGIGLLVVNVVRPGAGLNADPASLDAASVAGYASGAKSLDAVEFLLNIIPSSVVDAFAKGEILQVLLFAVLFGLALAGMQERGAAVVQWLEQANDALFGVVGMIMRLAPAGAFGAMAFTIGKYGLAAVLSLGKLMASVYLTCILFVALVLGTIARLHGFSLWRLLAHIQEEILIVLGTSSSESALPRLMAKLESFGCRREVVGLVVPTGYSFNLDGTSIYLTMAALFIAQATNTPLDLAQQLALLAVLMLTSKGAAAVTGGGFIVLAATLSSTGTVPVAGLALLLGVDRFMSEARAITNLIGNAVATVVVAKWEGAFHNPPEP